MRRFLFVLVVCIANLANAQNKWSIGGNASLDYSYRFNNNGDEEKLWNGKSINEMENHGTGFTLGLKAKYNLTKNVSLMSGIGFWQNNYESSTIITTQSINPDFPYKYNWSYRKEYFQLPISASFYFGENLKFGATIGLAVNFSTLQSRTEYSEYINGTSKTYIKGEIDKSTGKNILFTSGILGVGASYSYKQFEFRFEPTYNCKIFDISPKTDLYLWNLGTNLSVFYKL